MAETDITVTSTTIPAMIITGLRYILAFMGGVLIQRGVITAEQSLEITGLVLGVVPLAWGVYASFTGKKKLIIAADPTDPRQVTLK